MQNKYVRCIKIVHHPAEVKMYRMLSAFFRFVGIFVCENLIGDEYGDEVDWISRIEEGSEDGSESLEDRVNSVLIEMEEQVGEEDFEVLNQIWEMFNEYDLMRGSYAIDYFGNSGRKYIYQRMEQAIENFESVLGQLELLEQSREEKAWGNVYLWMAKANCRRRIYEIYTMLWSAIDNGKYQKDLDPQTQLRKLYEEHYIDFEAVIEDIQKVLDKEPQFFAAYAVRGFVKEINEDYMVESVDDIKKAIALIGDKSYTSYLYYRIGRYYEKIRPNMDKKMIYYRKAVEADHHNFRAVYKLALNEQDHNHFTEAKELWEDILEILGIKWDLPSSQTVECAYLYKAYRKLGVLYNRTGHYTKGIEFLKKAEKIYNNKRNEDSKKGFYPWMFGNNFVEDENKKSWEVYKEAARLKLQIQKVYVAIVDASARRNLQDVHAKYVGYLA